VKLLNQSPEFPINFVELQEIGLHTVRTQKRQIEKKGRKEQVSF